MCGAQGFNNNVNGVLMMSKREMNEVVFKSVVAYVSKSKNQVGIRTLVKYVAMDSNVSEDYAYAFIALMYKKDMVELTDGVRGMSVVSLTKLACDKYRELKRA